MLSSAPRQLSRVVVGHAAATRVVSCWLLRSAGCGSTVASFATKARKGSDTSFGESTRSSTTAAAPSSSSSYSKSSSSSSSPAGARTPRSMSRAGYQRAASLLSAAPAPASPESTSPSRPSSARPQSTSAPLSSAPSPAARSLRIPLVPDRELVDPQLARRTIDGQLMDYVLEGELEQTLEKLVYTRPELAAAMERERLVYKQLREAKRRTARKVASRQPRELTAADAVPPGEQQGQLVDHIDVESGNEKLDLTNPESMRRRASIELKRVRLTVEEKLFDIEERLEERTEQQAREVEQARQERQARLLKVEKGEEDVKAVNAERFDPNRRVRDEEARLALEAARLRENAVYRYEQEYGEREGDDYALPPEEFERLYEQSNQELPVEAQLTQTPVSVRVRRVDKQGRSFASGTRKAAKAIVWMKPGTGVITVNHRPHSTYFHRYVDRGALYRPFQVAMRVGMYDVTALTCGGGHTGQSGAIRLAIARALVKQEPVLRDRLDEEALLTVDTRKKERRKPGRPKARKRYTFVKR